MQWLIAAAVLLLAVKVRKSRESSGYVNAPDQSKSPPAALFWTHKTTAGFECAGYCDSVERQGDHVLFNGMVCIDLTEKSGVDTPKFLSVPVANLRRVSNAAMGCVVLPQLIAGGILDGNAGLMLFDNVTAAQATRARIAGHSLEISRKTPNLYRVSDDTDWGVFWQAAFPFPVDVEITPAGVA